MKVLVAGADGYIGFPLSMSLANSGFDVIGIDKFLRRKWVAEVGSHSATPIRSMQKRLRAFEQSSGKKIDFEYGDLRDYDFVYHVLDKHRPDTILHLGEQSSAPFSMIDIAHATLTQTNNIVGTLNLLHAMHRWIPKCHLVKLGSMGEYGCPNVDIPEGFFDVEYRGRKDILPFPKKALGDWYHWSKVHDSGNVMLACEIWDLRSTDIMQGVVYGLNTNETTNDDLLTRFDFDAVFGTCINRFCAQAAIGSQLTPYGMGGQKRPVIALRDVIECLKISIENPPEEGVYRVFNQYDEVYTVNEMADRVKKVANKMGLDVQIGPIENPRHEMEKNVYYNPLHEKLHQLGFKPAHTLEEELETMLTCLVKHKQRIIDRKDQILPKVHWKA